MLQTVVDHLADAEPEDIDAAGMPYVAQDACDRFEVRHQTFG
jgi:hypothetical protein